jgi:cell division protein FtsZ
MGHEEHEGRKTEHEGPAGAKHARPRIVVFGVGGCGLASLAKVADPFFPPKRYADVYAVDSDAENLHYYDEFPASHRLLIGKSATKGLGSGGIPLNGETAAKEEEKTLRQAVKGAVLVYVSCGLGGGTGTGATCHLVKVAKSEGAAVIVQATFPFMDEGVRRLETAKAGLDRLRKEADKVLLMHNQKLLETTGDRAAAKKAIEDVTANAVKDAVHFAIVALHEKGLKPAASEASVEVRKEIGQAALPEAAADALQQ